MTSEQTNHGLPVHRNFKGHAFPTALLDGETPVHLIGYTITSWQVRHADGREEWIFGGGRITDRQADRRK